MENVRPQFRERRLVEMPRPTMDARKIIRGLQEELALINQLIAILERVKRGRQTGRRVPKKVSPRP